MFDRRQFNQLEDSQVFNVAPPDIIPEMTGEVVLVTGGTGGIGGSNPVNCHNVWLSPSAAAVDRGSSRADFSQEADCRRR